MRTAWGVVCRWRGVADSAARPGVGVGGGAMAAAHGVGRDAVVPVFVGAEVVDRVGFEEEGGWVSVEG